MKKKFNFLMKMTGVSLASLFVVWLLFITTINVNSSFSSTGVLEVISVNPDRPHRVAPGTTTTFVLWVVNPESEPVSAQVTISGQSEDWHASLSEGDNWFQSIGEAGSTLDFPEINEGEGKVIVVSMTPAATLEDGQLGTVELEALLSSSAMGSATFQGIVNSQPKIYFLGIDAAHPSYAMLGRHGERDPSPDELLMPNTRGFLKESAWYPKARCSMPSGTDMNVLGLFSGSWPGTLGIPYVGFFFKGWDEEGNPVSSKLYRNELRYGPAGDPILTIYDIAKDPAYGGNPDTFTAFLGGKGQMDNLLRTGWETNVDVLADGQIGPYYLTTPRPYYLGDPVSDEDAETDRDGTNIYPLSEFKMHSSGFGLDGDDPLSHPEDRWLARNTQRVIAAEDPDILAIWLGNVDKIQHAAGTANTPEEWIDPGTPNILWDDISSFNWNANREPVIDVVFEADVCIGLLLATLEARGVTDRSIMVLASDHSQTTYMTQQLDMEEILASEGLLDHFRRISGWGNIATLFLWDEGNPDLTYAAEQVLENYTTYHPVLQRDVRPFALVTRDEMESGVDSVLGRFSRDGGPWRGEMYSRWLINYPVEDNSKVVWPEMILLSQYHFQVKKTNPVLSHMYGGHADKWAMPILYAIKGPDFAQGLFQGQDPSLVDIIPTIYEVMGWTSPANVDGRVLTEILLNP